MQTGKLTLRGNSIVHKLAVNDEAPSQRGADISIAKLAPRLGPRPRGGGGLRLCAKRGAAAHVEVAAFPNGLANSSGELGRNFIPHITAGFELFLEDFIGKPPENDEGFLDHAYIPSFMHDQKRDYPRSFGVQFGYHNHRSTGWARSIKGMGKSYKEAVKARYPAYMTFSPYQEMLPNADSYIDLDTEQLDEYGLPASAPPLEAVGDGHAASQRYEAPLPGDSGSEPRADSLRQRQSLPPTTKSAVAAWAPIRALRAGCYLPRARRAESLRGGRQRVPVVVRKESDSDDHGARLAHRRYHRRPSQKREV